MRLLKKGLLLLVICGLFYIYAQNLKHNLDIKTSIETTPPAIHHIVMCWLKNPSSELRNQILKQSDVLKKIPQLKTLSYGNVLQSERPIVDDSFDLGFVMTFDSVEDMTAYIEHPIHKRFVEDELTPYLDRVLVYDF